MYQCQELVTSCVRGLKKNVNDDNIAEVFDVARLVDSWPLKEVIFARMMDMNDPMGALGGVELSPQEVRKLIEVFQGQISSQKG